ncbi:MAG: hypothetical protein K5985_00970 [Lachnospiraceae bacterium]|nr:hypothetical protein [Lachnospiraceae bacterium]
MKDMSFARIDDDALENVSGGTGKYSKAEYGQAGVNVNNDGGKTIYIAVLSNGEKRQVSEIVANSMVDCYRLNGQKLTVEQFEELVKQC